MLQTCPELVMCSGRYEARIAPSAGGRVTHLSWLDDSGHTVQLLAPLSDTSFDSHQWPKAGAFPMIPFANQLPDAGIFAKHEWGKLVSVTASGRQHGLVHRRAWKVNSANKIHIHLSFTHDQVSVDWPWRFSAEMEVDLHDHGMAVMLRLTNNAEQAMPAAIGWHPYHPLESPLAKASKLVFEADQIVPLDSSGKISPRHEWAPFSAFPPLKTFVGTTAFSGWKHAASLKINHNVEIKIGGHGWDNQVIHQPASGQYICVEPITLLPGAIGQYLEPDGLGILLPGKTLTATWTCAAHTPKV
jgi:aldose 1-epimerase